MAKEMSEAKATAKKYAKEQLLRSERYAKRRDLVGVLLENGRQYTLEEVDAVIENFFRKNEVK